MAPHESPTSSQQSSAEGEGESTPEEQTDGHGAETATPEQPLSLSDLLGYVKMLAIDCSIKILFINSGEAAKRAAQEKAEAQAAQQAAMQAIETESKQSVQTEVSAISQINFGAYGQRAVSFLARNFYNLKYVALVLAFCINFMLLFYKVNIFCNIIFQKKNCHFFSLGVDFRRK